MTFEDAVWIGLGLKIDADNNVTVPKRSYTGPLVRLRSYNGTHWVQAYGRHEGWAFGSWSTVLILTDLADAEDQTEKWTRKMAENPYSHIAWDMKENRL